MAGGRGASTGGTAIARRGKKAPLAVERLLALVRASLADDRAEDVIAIELAGKANFADYMVVASGRSRRQVGTIAEHLRERLKKAGLASVPVEGAPQCDWILIDAGDVVVHVFRPEVRAFYNLERMWTADFPEERSSEAGG